MNYEKNSKGKGSYKVIASTCYPILLIYYITFYVVKKLTFKITQN